MQRNYYANIDQLANGFADFASNALQNDLTKKRKASLVVPGGNTPRHYLPPLANCPLPWDKITITLSDERWVDVNSDESNENLITKHLLAHLPDNTCFVGLKTQHHTPFEAINEIHQRLNSMPQPFSLTVLGLGEDGHIASLFPGMSSDDQGTIQHCVAVDQPIAPSPRISLSLTALANSRHIALVVVGKAKRQLLDQLSENPNPQIPLAWLLQRSHSPITVFETD
jgi:6-phosphogluconolactonase